MFLDGNEGWIAIVNGGEIDMLSTDYRYGTVSLG
jgi:hypothetical protein